MGLLCVVQAKIDLENRPIIIGLAHFDEIDLESRLIILN